MGHDHDLSSGSTIHINLSLCGLFSSTVREDSMTQYHHLHGEVNAISKLDTHYHGLFGFLAIIDDDI